MHKDDGARIRFIPLYGENGLKHGMDLRKVKRMVVRRVRNLNMERETYIVVLNPDANSRGP